jgi:hypothetical protein
MALDLREYQRFIFEEIRSNIYVFQRRCSLLLSAFSPSPLSLFRQRAFSATFVLTAGRLSRWFLRKMRNNDKEIACEVGAVVVERLAVGVADVKKQGEVVEPLLLLVVVVVCPQFGNR